MYSTKKITSFTLSIYTSCRDVSFHYVRPRPRPYRRRLYEAALAPVLPKDVEMEWKKLNDPFNINSVSSTLHEKLNDNEVGFSKSSDVKFYLLKYK